MKNMTNKSLFGFVGVYLLILVSFLDQWYYPVSLLLDSFGFLLDRQDLILFSTYMALAYGVLLIISRLFEKEEKEK